MIGKRFLEVQVHAPDIRRGVLYLFFERRQLLWLGAGVALLATFIAAGLAMMPGVARNQLSGQQYRELEQQRAQQGERLKSLLQRMQTLAGAAEEQRLRIEKVYLAYGLPQMESRGQGGFPVRPNGTPQSIYAETILHGSRLQASVQEELQVLGSFLREVQAFERDHSERVLTTPSVCPLSGRDFVLTSPFGMRRNPFTKAADFHAGLDLAAQQGTPVHAPADAVVIFAGRYDLRQNVSWWRYGNLVVLRHDDRFTTLFGHLDSVAVKSGQRVDQGQVIGAVGNTGWSTSPHLHYEVRRFDGRDFKPVDPRVYILDHRWRDEERLLVRARSTPDAGNYEPLPFRAP
jgi:murein DD-endopeptidase MepM/ murein hydrolase activator NlpD